MGRRHTFVLTVNASNVSKYFSATLLVLLCCYRGLTQDSKGSYAYKAFPIIRVGGQLTLAGDIHAFVYSGFSGQNVRQEGFTQPHSRPETLVYALFLALKANDINAVGRLYDTSFDRSEVDMLHMAGF